MKKIYFTFTLLFSFSLLKSQAVFHSDTFYYSGTVNTFIVHECVDTLYMKVWGAQGGANWVGNTNYGGYSQGYKLVSAGDTFYVYVGEQPSGITGGWNGGGNGETSGKGGGGASDIRFGGQNLNNRIIVAGGGGGAGYWSGLHVVGGQGGGVTGGNGYREPDYSTNPGGLGATQVSGGANGTCSSQFNTICAGTFGQGGAPLGCGCEGYGGGGGWYGGAGSGNCRGGGGGSGYTAGVINGFMQQGIRTGHGMVVLEYYTSTPPLVTLDLSPTTSCDNLNSYPLSGGVPSGGIYSSPFVFGNAFDASLAGLGYHTITYIYTDTLGCSAEAIDSIFVNQAPTVSFTYNGLDSICLDQEPFAISGGNPPGGNYFGTGISSNNFDASVTGSGTFGMSYVYIDANGCQGSAGGEFITVLGCMGLEEYYSKDVTLFPNPFKEYTTVKINGNEIKNGEYRITDLSGKVLIQKTFSGDQVIIYNENLKNGIYLLEIYSNNLLFSIHKLFKH